MNARIYQDKRIKRLEGTAEFFDMPGVKQAILASAPEGSELVFREIDHSRDLWQLIIWSASYDVVPEGGLIPEFEIKGLPGYQHA